MRARPGDLRRHHRDRHRGAATAAATNPELSATLVFAPGVDYATNADSVTVQLRRGPTRSPPRRSVTRNLGNACGR
jgi:hypothetical protein